MLFFLHWPEGIDHFVKISDRTFAAAALQPPRVIKRSRKRARDGSIDPPPLSTVSASLSLTGSSIKISSRG